MEVPGIDGADLFLARKYSVTSPITKPTMIDSNGKPGISNPPPPTV
jgi:hypothetical protein